MATVKELKEWLNRFPDDTIVKIGIQERPSDYESWGPVRFKEIKLEDSDFGDGWDFTDFTGNPFTKADSKHYNKRYLTLGEAN